MFNMSWFRVATVILLASGIGSRVFPADVPAPRFQLASFSADITIPLNHRCMGVLPTKSKKIVDPLNAHGLVLLGAGKPIVLVAFDWCEIRNDSYDQWRRTLAAVARTTPERVLVCSVHQHDAPVIDAGAAKLLKKVGLEGELFDQQFHARMLQRVADAMRDGLRHPTPLTHIGLGQAKVQRIASNRRVVHPDGHVGFDRGSRSGGDSFYRDAPVGTIDPYLKAISFWNQDTPVLVVNHYATHPMSYYGQGGVSWDFVGMARHRRQQDMPHVHQIYVTGCAGDITAGKYNDGSHAHRLQLAKRLYQAMCAAWQQTKRFPLHQVAFRNTQFMLEFNPASRLTETALRRTLHDSSQSVETRILAAMGLSSRLRVAAGRKIDMPCIDFGPAQIVLLPGESFIKYQLMAQQIRPDSFVMAIAYGECWPGYIPTDAEFNDGFTDKWLWVARGSETRMRGALRRVLLPPP